MKNDDYFTLCFNYHDFHQNTRCRTHMVTYAPYLSRTYQTITNSFAGWKAPNFVNCYQLFSWNQMEWFHHFFYIWLIFEITRIQSVYSDMSRFSSYPWTWFNCHHRFVFVLKPQINILQYRRNNEINHLITTVFFNLKTWHLYKCIYIYMHARMTWQKVMNWVRV